ncbi:hypothetical protein [Shouchella miscanthi]|uniref:DUF4747 domain-containing protein n=1 Tax=Shouchella miscanthi TaxID=2598861 RepID=A0ABU6NEW8_9BACI|nr:hypothetical protein [Shouchella miscanthi]
MALLYFSKVNVNANIFDVYSEEIKIKDILDQLYFNISDEKEYAKREEKTFINDEGNFESIVNEELYNFSELEKVTLEGRKYITGKLIRRYPLHTEQWDIKKRESRKVTHSNNSTSIFFYFDISTEIISFTERQKFGFKQFNEAFQELLNIYMDSTGFEIFLLNDPFTIEERLRNAHKIYRLKSTIIPPNNNDSYLKELYDDEVSQMQESNVQKKTNIFEVHKKSVKGINIEADMVKRVVNSNVAIDKFARGYGTIEVDGEDEDGTKFSFNSEVHSPYKITIKESIRSNKKKLIEKANKAIDAFMTR